MDLHAKELREEFWRNDAMNGFPIGKPYKEIEFLSESTEKQGRELRNVQLRDILDYTRKNCPFYSYLSGVSA